MSAKDRLVKALQNASIEEPNEHVLQPFVDPAYYNIVAAYEAGDGPALQALLERLVLWGRPVQYSHEKRLPEIKRVVVEYDNHEAVIVQCAYPTCSSIGKQDEHGPVNGVFEFQEAGYDRYSKMEWNDANEVFDGFSDGWDDMSDDAGGYSIAVCKTCQGPHSLPEIEWI